MRIFISGGCKNGKSFYAQHLAKAQGSALGADKDKLYYIATMRPVDSEDDARILRHRKEREGWGFTTVEQPVNIENILVSCDCKGSFLLDSATALLANEMFPPNGAINENAAEKIITELTQVLLTVKNIVVVSDYIYSDALRYDPLTEKYRQSLAKIDRMAARICDAVLEVSYTNVLVHKGREALDGLPIKQKGMVLI